LHLLCNLNLKILHKTNVGVFERVDSTNLSNTKFAINLVNSRKKLIRNVICLGPISPTPVVG
jgi:hypothetical protein